MNCLTGGKNVTVFLIIVSVYVLIILGEPFQRDADEPEENDEEVSEPRNNEDSGIDESEIDEFVENDDSKTKNIANDARRKFSYNIF